MACLGSLLPRRALKLFNTQLAVDYPLDTMVCLNTFLWLAGRRAMKLLKFVIGSSNVEVFSGAIYVHKLLLLLLFF